MEEQDFMVMTVNASAENVGLLRLAVAVFASRLPFTMQEIEEIKVAVSEAVTNAVVHAYPDRPGIVEIRADIEKDTLRIEIRDQGIGIPDLARAREHGFSSDPERLGMGFYFMETLMDSMEVNSTVHQGTRVILRRRPQGELPNEDEHRPAVG